MKTIRHLVLFLVATLGAQGQTDALFSNVNRAQKLRLKHTFSEQRDSVFYSFDTAINALLSSSEVCRELPDTTNHYFLINKLKDISPKSKHISIGQKLAYAFMNNIVITSSGQIKIYSWDDLGGGSYHSYTNYLQYTDDKGNCITNPIDTKEEDSEVGYYDIVQTGNYYIAFGYGTYGGGKQHFLIKILKYQNNAVIELNQLEIGSNRSQNIDLKYNPKDSTISYKAYKFESDVGFYSEDYETLNLKFENGKLLKI
ncbi:MAG: hypothetical protein AAFX55_20805 [Bacteroidota bacterium]